MLCQVADSDNISFDVRHKEEKLVSTEPCQEMTAQITLTTKTPSLELLGRIRQTGIFQGWTAWWGVVTMTIIIRVIKSTLTSLKLLSLWEGVC